MTKTVLVTGGAGYIASHTIIELLYAGYNVISLDNYSNSSAEIYQKIRAIVGDALFDNLKYYYCDISVDKLYTYPRPDWIIHFAAYKNVGESNDRAHDYYYNNMVGFLNIMKYAKDIDCKNIIFSSSATVYSEGPLPFKEEGPNVGALSTRYPTIHSAAHPYGATKVMCEQILHDIAKSDSTWNITILRYFNPVGNHPTGIIGDDYKPGKANNLFPAILGAVTTSNELNVFGSDYDTIDGTPARDYIHVCDLARAHVLAILNNHGEALKCYNVGVGKAYTVMEVINEFIKQSAQVKYKLCPRREGDAPVSYCDNKKILEDLEWAPKCNLEDMVRDTLKYYIQNIKS